jgi:hypothetical protein
MSRTRLRLGLLEGAVCTVELLTAAFQPIQVKKLKIKIKNKNKFGLLKE